MYIFVKEVMFLLVLICLLVVLCRNHSSTVYWFFHVRVFCCKFTYCIVLLSGRHILELGGNNAIIGGKYCDCILNLYAMLLFIVKSSLQYATEIIINLID